MNRTLLLMLVCISTQASEFRLFDHQSKQYEAWMRSKRELLVVKAANFVGIPKRILLGVCKVESNLRDVGAVMDNGSNSYGICQVKLATAQYVDKVYKHKSKATRERLQDPFVNAVYAAKLLKLNFKRYADWSKAIEAYNKGFASKHSMNSKYFKKVLIAMAE